LSSLGQKSRDKPVGKKKVDRTCQRMAETVEMMGDQDMKKLLDQEVEVTSTSRVLLRQESLRVSMRNVIRKFWPK